MLFRDRLLFEFVNAAFEFLKLIFANSKIRFLLLHTPNNGAQVGMNELEEIGYRTQSDAEDDFNDADVAHDGTKEKRW